MVYNRIDSNLKIMYKYSITLYITTVPKIPKHLHELWSILHNIHISCTITGTAKYCRFKTKMAY